jgi:iron complex transport system substrate-binding protein
MRIVSLLPSATEIVYLLGLGDHLVGVSHECDHPAQARDKPRIIRPAFATASLTSGQIDRRVRDFTERGEGIYQIDPDALRAAAPDLVLTQELCDVCAAPYQDVLAAVAALPKRPAVLSLTPQSFGDVLKDIERVGEATGRIREAQAAVAALEKRTAAVAGRAARAQRRPRVVCLEWLEPVMAAGHWVPEMVGLAGGTEPIGLAGAPSRRVSWEQVRSAAPEILILMPCGFDVERVMEEMQLLTSRPGWQELPAVATGRVFAANGHAYYSRSGPRLVDGLEVLARLIHPELFPEPVPPDVAMIVR